MNCSLTPHSLRSAGLLVDHLGRSRARLALLLGCVLTALPSSAQSPITALAFTPRGDALVAGSQDQLDIRAWPTLDRLRQVDVDSGQIHDVQFSPDGNRLLIVGGFPSDSGAWRIVAWPELDALAAGSGHDDVIYAADWLSENEFVTVGADNRIIQWRSWMGGGRKVRLFSGHSRRVLCVEVLAASQHFVTAGVDHSLRIWQRAENSVTDTTIADHPPTTTDLSKVLDHHTGVVRDLAARPGGSGLELLASAGADKTVRLWQPTIGRLVRFARLDVEALSIAWSLNGRRLAVGCVDGKLRMLDPATVTVKSEIDAFRGWVYEVAAAGDGSFAVAGTGGQLRRIVPKLASPD